jgi:Tfp pilus assembly protein PilV
MAPLLKRGATSADGSSMHRGSRGEKGMTLIELMFAVFVLMVGILAVATMANMANKIVGDNNARTGATNLAREITEDIRSIDYKLLTDDQLPIELHKRPGMTTSSGNPFTVVRRNVTYTVTLDSCQFDNARDGLYTGTPPLSDPCPTNAGQTSTIVDRNGDDFRRITVSITWTRHAATTSMKQTEMIVNPAGGLGPRIISLYQPAGQVSSGTTLAFPATTTSSAALRYTAGPTSGDGTGGDTSWTWTWNLGSTYGSPDYVVDGAYTITAQAFDINNSPGDARFSNVLLNRDKPQAQTGFRGGRDEQFSGIVDMRWNASDERDIRAYRVYRVDSSGVETLICTVDPDVTPACTDPNPPSGALTYRIYGVDLTDLANPTSSLRQGTPVSISIGSTAGTRPDKPTGVTNPPTIENGSPRFNWTQTGTTPAFYRVYRRAGTGGSPTLADRYALTFTNTPTYLDPKPLSVPATYWFAAVDSSFNESNPSDPVVYTP